MQFVLSYVRPVLHSESTRNIPLSEVNEEVTQTNEGQTEEQIETVSNKATNERIKQPRTPQTSRKGGRKRKFNQKIDKIDKTFMDYLNHKKDNNTNDHRRMFLLSLLPDVTQLSDNNLRQFKIKSMILLENLLASQTSDSAPMLTQETQYSSNNSTKLSPISSPHPSTGSSATTPIMFTTNEHFDLP